MIESGEIDQWSEVFVFTDNSIAKSTMYKRPSSSEMLHETVLEL